MPEDKPVEDYPLDRTWQTGRRIYVRATYGSKLDTDLRRIGATWDPHHRARWVGTTKRDQVLAALQAHRQRTEAVDEIHHLGLWVSIPYEQAAIRQAAKDRGALWNNNRKQWACRTRDDYDALTQMVKDHEHAQREEAQQQNEQERQQVIDKADRQTIGEWSRHQIGPLDVSGHRSDVQGHVERTYPAGTIIGTNLLVLRHARLDFIREGDDTANGEYYGPTGWFLTLEVIRVEAGDSQETGR